jgi:2'-5' RNA ligase
MDGIVSLLDLEHKEQVQGLWDELEHEFGLCGIFTTRFPHFSYHVAGAYDCGRLGPILARFAHGHEGFTAHATGLGIFTGPQPVLFIPVVRTPELTRLHQELWWAVAGTAAGTIDLYHPHTWVPHITLAHGDLTAQMLPDVIRFLSGRDFTWNIRIADLVLVMAAGTGDERQVRFPLATGKKENPIADEDYS